MDEIDFSQALEEQQREEALKQHRQRNQGKPLGFNETLRHCIDCEDAIPLQRVKATGALKCIACQEIAERFIKIKGGG